MKQFKTALFKLDSIFSEVRTGDFHASSHLEKGNMPLISCKTEKTDGHGVEGYFNIPFEKTYEKCVTITCDGDQPSTAFFHPYRFAVKDNVLLCIPKQNIKFTTILYAIACLNRERWRYSYGRKCYENKKNKLLIPFPITSNGIIDEKLIKSIIKIKIKDYLPQQNIEKEKPLSKINFGLMPITSLFHIESGDFHNAYELPDGEIPLVSCGEKNNGIIRGCDVPPDKIYKNMLTIAYNGHPLTTTFHSYPFATKDDVAICIPNRELKTTTLIYFQYAINRQKWRYSYGRKCFKSKLLHLKIQIPMNKNNDVDEEVIEKIVKNTTYWNYLSEIIHTPNN